ncbi:MAG: hypothetical protein IKE57_05200 [Oscillospiraceae bacterium]|nr:hypothetical protein [Oscillospiraceae bacterium]
MENRYTKKLMIPLSACDSTARLAVHNTFALFMDIATVHAEELGCGAGAMMGRGLFWLTVRTKILFHRMPRLMEEVAASTWPGVPGKFKVMRYYTLESGGELLAEGKTEWAVSDMRTGRLQPADGIYPPELILDETTAADEPFVRISDDFPPEELGRYTVRSTDIDLGGHMNNAAYVRAVMGMFAAKQLKEMRISAMDVCFRAPCYEGETLTVRSKETGGALDLGMIRPDGKTALLVRIG